MLLPGGFGGTSVLWEIGSLPRGCGSGERLEHQSQQTGEGAGSSLLPRPRCHAVSSPLLWAPHPCTYTSLETVTT